jgi:hypothetical protein
VDFNKPRPLLVHSQRAYAQNLEITKSSDDWAKVHNLSGQGKFVCLGQNMVGVEDKDSHVVS